MRRRRYVYNFNYFNKKKVLSRCHLKIFCIPQYHSVNVKFEEPYPLLPHTGQGQLPRGERGFLGWCVWGNYFRKLQLLSVILPLIALPLCLLPPPTVSSLSRHILLVSILAVKVTAAKNGYIGQIRMYTRASNEQSFIITEKAPTRQGLLLIECAF